MKFFISLALIFFTLNSMDNDEKEQIESFIDHEVVIYEPIQDKDQEIDFKIKAPKVNRLFIICDAIDQIEGNTTLNKNKHKRFHFNIKTVKHRCSICNNDVFLADLREHLKTHN